MPGSAGILIREPLGACLNMNASGIKPEERGNPRHLLLFSLRQPERYAGRFFFLCHDITSFLILGNKKAPREKGAVKNSMVSNSYNSHGNDKKNKDNQRYYREDHRSDH